MKNSIKLFALAALLGLGGCHEPDELRLDHHAFDPGRRAFHHDLAQVVVLLDPHLPHDGVEPEVLYRQVLGNKIIIHGPSNHRKAKSTLWQ